MEGIITIDDPKYPKLLKSISDAPKKLYYKGNWSSEIFNNCLAVVGSRRMTTYGKQITEKLVSQIASNDITIVSGFMYGIDGTAHQSCLDVGGKTIAVMPCGRNVIHPYTNKLLYNSILKSGGLIMSEFEDGFQPRLWTYPKRNRIVAGLSRAVLIVEAGEKSGSLITAEIARKEKRKVFTIPKSIFEPNYEGVEYLLNSHGEAISSADPINKFYGFSQRSLVKDLNVNSSLYDTLSTGPLSMDEILIQTKSSASEVLKELTLLQMKNLVAEEKGRFYAC